MPVVAVAASGGCDSTALLHCTARSAAALGLQVVALHVHHGLMPQADAWLAQVHAQCMRWGVGFHSRRLLTRPAHGDSIEAWARRERYRALGDLARAAGAGLVLLAHHRRDQAETWLLQALRGGGPAGLAAMPRLASRDGLVWARPWLDQPRDAVQAYVRQHRLSFVDDASNTDPRYARSRLRSAVWPVLTASFADAEKALAHSAARAQEAAAVLAEVAAQDLAGLRVAPRPTAEGRTAAPDEFGPQCEGLKLDPWLALSPARRLNALRAWLVGVLLQPPPETLLQRLVHELPAAQTALWPAGPQWLRLYRGELTVAAAAPPAGGVAHVEPAMQAAGPVLVLDLSQAGEHSVPGWPGRFVVEPGAGLDPALLRQVLVRPRRGGEQFQRSLHSIPRSLKKQYQSAAIPVWQRHGPLLFSPGGALLFVPGLGLDSRCLASAGAPQLSLRLRWVPDAPVMTGQRQPAL